jgi:molybdate transport system substrate-binding protein
MMQRSVVAAMGILLGALSTLSAHAAEIRILSAVAVGPAVKELGSQFEKSTGHTLTIQYGPVGELRRQVDGGTVFDVTILTPPQIEELIKAGKVAAGTRTDIARAGLGVAVRTGASKPNVGSPDSFKQALLDAKSVAYAGEGAAGLYFLSLLDRLGIADQIKPKLKAIAGSPVKAVASGEAEIAVANAPPILDDRAVELAGPLPAELQNYLVYSAGIAAGAKEAEAGKAFVGFFTSESAVPVVKAKGMEPAAR